MSFDSALSHRDSRTISGASAATASGGADSINIMAKKNKPTTTENPAMPSTTPINTPQTPLAKLQSAVRRAERAFLTAVEGGGDGADERAALKAAKVELATFMANRLPIAVKSANDVLTANGGDITTEDAIAAITELRSALSGIAKPAQVVTSAAPAAS